MPGRGADRLTITLALLIAAARALAQDLYLPPPTAGIANGTVQESAVPAWRCSFDGKYYVLTYSNGLRIRPIRSGQMTANIPLKTDKKGRSTLEGQWRSGSGSGLLVIQQMEDGYIRGSMLVPAQGAGLPACNSRKEAVFFSIGRPRPVCNAVSIGWTRVPNLSAVQAANEESATELLTASYATQSQSSEQGGSSGVTASDGSLAGTWSNESATAVSYVETRLVLRPDGTYTKTFGARPPGMGGGVVGAATWGDTHSGTWSVVGPMQVRLSGDGQHTPYIQNLSQLTRE
jgi:hypothetical protein